MVAAFHLYYLGHIWKSWGRKYYTTIFVNNTTMLQYWVYWIIFILSVMFFLHCMLNILRYEKIFCEIDESVASQNDPSSGVIFMGVHSESIFPFMQFFFFLRKLCFLWSPCLLLIAELISLDTSGKPTVGFFLKITSPSWIILSISLDEPNSIDWLLLSWW